jgi:sodium transport system permease protein
VAEAVDAYNAALAPPVPRPLTIQTVDLARPEAQGAGLLAFLLPYLVVLFLFAGSMNLGLAVTVMEKEKGSLALLLVNQVSRTSIALGKVLFVVASGLVNTVTSGLGMVGGLLLQGALAASTGPALTVGIGGLAHPGTAVVVLGTVFVASILSSALVVWIGVTSRTMKQAGGYVTPVYLVVMVGAIAGSSLDAATSFGLHFVPLLNVVMVLKAAVLGQLQTLPVVVTTLVNAGVGAFLVWRTARAFESENVLATV